MDLEATNDSSATLAFADTVVVGWGAGCNAQTNVSDQIAHLKPNEPTTLTITGTTVDFIRVEFALPHNMDLRLSAPGPRGQPASPAQYAIYVDGVPSTSIEDPNTNCAPYERTWHIEIRSNNDVRRRNSRGADDETEVPETQAPGDGTWAELGPGRDFDPAIASIRWSVGLGRLLNGKSVGRIYYNERGLTNGSYTPSSLSFSQPIVSEDQVTVIHDLSVPTAEILRQVRAPQAFLDVVTITSGFELRFYPLTHVSSSTNAMTGYYDILTNAPFVTWKFVNPDGTLGSSPRLQLMELRSNPSCTNEVAFNSTNKTWTLTRGAGTDLRKETRRVVVSIIETNDTSTNALRYETNVVESASGIKAYHAIETYNYFPWGFELTALLVDPATNALLTEYEFEAANPGVPNYGKLITTWFPDGSWETRDYDDDFPVLPNRISRPYKDSTPPEGLGDEGRSIVSYGYATLGGTPFQHKIGYATHTNGYRYDARRVDVVAGTSRIRESYVRGGNPDCDGALPVEGTIRHSASAGAAAGHLAMSLTNFHLGITNTYEWGALSGTTFTPGSGTDWRRTMIYGLGYFRDPQLEDHDFVKTIPGKSRKEIEIRRSGVPVQSEVHVYTGTAVDGNTFDLVYTDLRTNDVLGHNVGKCRLDAASSSLRTLCTEDWQGTNAFPGSLLLSETDEDGLAINYTYDSLKRLKTKTLLGAADQSDHFVIYAYDAMDRILTVATNAGGFNHTNKSFYDLAGRLSKSVDQAGLTTTYSYTNGGRTRTTTYPNGSTEKVDRFLSGDVKSITGTALIPSWYDYEWFTVDVGASQAFQWGQRAYRREVRGTSGFPSTNTYFNLWDRPILEVVNHHGFPLTNFLYYERSDGNLTRSVSPGGTNYIYQGYTYDSENLIEASWTFVDGGQGPTGTSPTEASRDRLSRSISVYTNISGSWYRATIQYAYLTDGSGATTRVSEDRQRLNGLASGVKAEMTMIDVDSNATVTTTYVDRANKKLSQVVDVPQSSLNATNITVNGLLTSESTPSVPASTQHQYDALRRRTRTTTPKGAAFITAYDSVTGRVSSTTDFAANTTSYAYYSATHTNAGRVSSITAPNGKKTYYAYNWRGQVIKTWGDVPYPEQRVYDVYGNLTELHTYRGGSGWSGNTWPASPGTADITRWLLDDECPWRLYAKEDAAGRQVIYAYHNTSLLRTRQWARGVYTTNSYNASGDLERLDYSDGTSCVIFTNYNRLGQPRTILDVAGERTLVYDHASRLIGDLGVSGLFTNIAVSNHFDSLGRRDFLEVGGLSAAVHHDYAYDGYGRLGSVTDGDESAVYGYLANSDQLQTTTFKHSGSPVMTTTRAWEYGTRLQSIASVVGTTTVSAHSYLYDAVQRRTQATLEDGSRWQYGYNDRDEVVSGKRTWADWNPVSGQQFEYSYDNIGNRLVGKSGGDDAGGSLRANGYAVNNFNQYTTITNAGYKDIIGAAVATNSVTVNGGSCDRKGEYFHRETTVTNGSGAIWHPVTVSSGGSSTNAGLALPGAQQSLTYDYDGNLTSDGIWNYRWDGENRLVEMVMTNVSSIPNAKRKRLQFAYDYMGRRIQKVVSAWNGIAFVDAMTNKFVYDGWNLLAILNQLTSVQQSFTWGPDLSGTMEEAGGIGGLLIFTDYSLPSIRHFPCYDGNGNLTGLIKTDSSISARYEYYPFGETLRITGPFSNNNPFRWSTKYTDEESGLCYYGYRQYIPSIGRWLARDPIEEADALNLYLFVNNSPTDWFDVLGMGKSKEKMEVGGFNKRSSLQDVKSALAEELKKTGGKYSEHAKKLKGLAKVIKRGGSMMIVGSLALSVYTTSLMADDAYQNAIQGNFSETGTPEREIEDMFVHLFQDDQAMADLDAAAAAALMSGEGGLNATIIWGELIQSASEYGF